MWNSPLNVYAVAVRVGCVSRPVPQPRLLALHLSPLVWAAGTMEAPESRRSGRIKGLFNVSCISVSQLKCCSFVVGLSWPTISVFVFAIYIGGVEALNLQ